LAKQGTALAGLGWSSGQKKSQITGSISLPIREPLYPFICSINKRAGIVLCPAIEGLIASSQKATERWGVSGAVRAQEKGHLD
jgi:hypothetical protein